VVAAEQDNLPFFPGWLIFQSIHFLSIKKLWYILHLQKKYGVCEIFIFERSAEFINLYKRLIQTICFVNFLSYNLSRCCFYLTQPPPPLLPV